MRKISADIIYDGLGNKFTDHVLVIDSLNKIGGLIPLQIAGEVSEIEKHEGFLCPGFVNAHCHLELSHLKGLIKEKTGINNFLNDLTKLRTIDEELIIQQCIEWDHKMHKNGIVAVGDICNTNHTIKAKQISKIYYYNFIETFALNPDKAEIAINKAKTLIEEFKLALSFPASITPHAPYSVSDKLFEYINSVVTPKDLLSIHNQESESENEFFKYKTGDLAKRLTDWGIDTSHIKASNNSSLKSYINKINHLNKLLLVHNTFIQSSDVDFLNLIRKHTYVALCPSANLYIENTLPDIKLLSESHLSICIGTDSLASNHDLNIWTEIKTIQKYFSEISTETLINWACYNGAEFLGIHNKYGSFEQGKSPGIVNVNGENSNIIA